MDSSSSEVVRVVEGLRAGGRRASLLSSTNTVIGSIG